MLLDAPLGRKTEYIQTYAPDLLYPIPRSLARDKIGLKGHSLPFDGCDIWNGFELSWLNEKGKPMIAIAEFLFPCTSAFIVESKSFKLYLNSFNQSIFKTPECVQKTLVADLEKNVQTHVQVKLLLFPVEMKLRSEFEGICLDALDIETQIYHVAPELLKTNSKFVDETVYSHLLKSNCLATGQPDWGSIFIRYSGPQIEHEQLLKYIISYRNHSGFAEHCIEQIFLDILERCQPNKLTVYARYTKRGGLDINPFRSNFEVPYDNIRLVRQ